MFTRNKMARITRIRPKPAYSLFPIVIAKCLHSPQQRSLLRTASVQNLLPALLVSTKFEFHKLRGFFRGRQERPLSHRVLASVHEQRMSAHHSRGSDTPIRTDGHVPPHLARAVQRPG